MITIETIRIWYGTLKFSSENLSLTKVTENGNMYSLNYHLSYIYIIRFTANFTGMVENISAIEAYLCITFWCVCNRSIRTSGPMA